MALKALCRLGSWNQSEGEKSEIGREISFSLGDHPYPNGLSAFSILKLCPTLVEPHGLSAFSRSSSFAKRSSSFAFTGSPNKCDQPIDTQRDSYADSSDGSRDNGGNSNFHPETPKVTGAFCRSIRRPSYG